MPQLPCSRVCKDSQRPATAGGSPLQWSARSHRHMQMSPTAHAQSHGHRRLHASEACVHAYGASENMAEISHFYGEVYFSSRLALPLFKLFRPCGLKHTSSSSLVIVYYVNGCVTMCGASTTASERTNSVFPLSVFRGSTDGRFFLSDLIWWGVYMCKKGEFIMYLSR